MDASLRALLSILILSSTLVSCGAPRIELDGWRAGVPARPAALRGDLEEDLAEVERLRSERRLDEARTLALALAAEQPQDGRVAWYASRAESDGLVLFADDEKAVRNAAAASALDYAERAAELGENSIPSRAQHAWALGASTHLQAMGDRSDHAHRTLAVAEEALARDPAEPTALATVAVVNLRLETLPWIANVMASNLPESSHEASVSYARRAVEARPSRENRLVLARCLRAAGEDGAARVVLEEALAAPALHPRDDALVPELERELE